MNDMDVNKILADKDTSASFFKVLESSVAIQGKMYARQLENKSSTDTISDTIIGWQDDMVKAFKNTSATIARATTKPFSDMNSSLSMMTELTRSGFSDLTNSIMTSDNMLKTSSDGVLNAVESMSSVVNKGLNGIAIVNEKSSDTLSNMYGSSEDSKDKGGLSFAAKGDTKKPNMSGLAGLLPSLGFLKKIPKIGKFIGKMSGMGKMFSTLGGKLGGLGKIAGKLGKFAKIGGPIVAGAMAIFDFGKGVHDAGKIIGKSKDELTNLEKAGAGIAGVISGLTFGLVDASTIYSGLSSMSDTIADSAKSVFDMLPNGVQDGLSSVFDFMFNTDTGIFKHVVNTFNEVINSLSDGNWVDAGITALLSPIRAIFGGDGVIASTFESVMSFLPETFTETLTGLKDTISNFMSGIVDKALDFLPDSVKSFMGITKDNGIKEGSTLDMISSVGGGMISDLGGFMGFGKEEKKVVGTSSTKKEKLNVLDSQSEKLGKVINISDKLSNSKRALSTGVKQESVVSPVNNVVSINRAKKDVSDLTPMQLEVRRERIVKFKEKSSKFRVSTKAPDSKVGMNASQNNMRKSSSAAPIIVNAPQAQKSSRPATPALVKRSGSPDLKIAMINSNALD